ncbi:MAG: fucose-binding protein [Actinomycetia bacterium]|nr:fucose-binding protein [Actinomycetes bacterium]
MLKGLDPYLTPELLAALAEMGHGDTLALVDRNYPAYSGGSPVIDLPHTTVADVLTAILTVFPVDAFPHSPVLHMLTDDGTEGPALPSCRAIWNAAEGRTVEDKGIDRHGDDGFYALAQKAYVTVRTGETLPYACYLIPKGVL